ncbi:hypothetical protein Tco_1347229 [Tanacetum coccineum]
MHFRKASPFGLVSMYRKNRDRHCAYRPVASIGGRSLEPAAIMLLILSRSRNECNDKSTSRNDTDIRPSYDTEPMVEVDSNVIPDSPDMCDNDIQTNQNAKDERVALANLIANLKLDIDKNKTIQKQLKKANASLTQELKECKYTLAETSRTLREPNSIWDSCLIVLQNKHTKLEKYMAFNDRTVDYDKLERKLNETLGLLAQKEIDIKEGLKLKAYEILVVKKKHDELVKQSHITKVLSMRKQRNQSIQTIRMLDPKGPTFNGRPTFANPVYLKKAQYEKPCLYEIPYDQSDPTNRLVLDREETLTLEREKLVDQAWVKHSNDHFRAPTAHDMEILIKTCLIPLALKTRNDSFTFVHELKQEMYVDLKYVESLKNEIDELESDKAEISNLYDILLQECVSNDITCSYFHSLSDLDAHSELQCLYLHKVKECHCLAQKLSKQTEFVSKEVYTELLQSFAKLEKHSISLKLALQQCQEQIKNDIVCKEKASNVFQKEREQYFKIQDLKAQLQDKNITISYLKKLIEKCKGKSVETKFDKPSIVRQPNAQRIQKPSVLGKPTPFSDSLEKKSFSQTKLVLKTNVSESLSKTVTPHSWPQVRKSSFAKPYDVNAPSPSRNSPKHVSFQSPRESIGSNDMVHNHYLEEAKKKAQLQKDKALNTKPSVQLYNGGGIPFQLKSDSLPHAHAQTTKTYYKHQDSSIKKAQVLKTKTSAYSDIQDLPSTYQVYQGRFLASFIDDSKYEHVGQDTRSQGDKDDQD